MSMACTRFSVNGYLGLCSCIWCALSFCQRNAHFESTCGKCFDVEFCYRDSFATISSHNRAVQYYNAMQYALLFSTLYSNTTIATNRKCNVVVTNRGTLTARWHQGYYSIRNVVKRALIVVGLIGDTKPAVSWSLLLILDCLTVIPKA